MHQILTIYSQTAEERYGVHESNYKLCRTVLRSFANRKKLTYFAATRIISLYSDKNQLNICLYSIEVYSFSCIFVIKNSEIFLFQPS